MAAASCYSGFVLLEDLHRLRDELEAIAARHGAQSLRVFGSVARGQESAESDIDFLVRMERGRTLLDVSRLKQEFERLLSRRVDIVSENGLSPRMKARVIQDARAL